LKKLDELIDRIHSLMDNHHNMTAKAVFVELTEMGAEASHSTAETERASEKLEAIEGLLRAASDLNEYKTGMRSPF